MGDPNALPTGSDEIVEASSQPGLGSAVDAGQAADAIAATEKAQGWRHSGNGLSPDIQSGLEERRAS